MKPSEMLNQLGISLPEPPQAVGSYISGTRVDNLVSTSGQISLIGGGVLYPGKVGGAVGIDLAIKAARQCGLNALAVAAQVAGGIDRIRRIVQLEVFVSSAPSFTKQHMVANGASDLMVKIFGDDGKHIRAAVGAVSLPFDSPVEVKLTVEIEPCPECE